MSVAFNVKHPALFNAESFKSPQDFCLKLLRKYSIPTPKVVVEIGGSVGANAHQMFPLAEYANLDLADSDKVKTIVCDVTKGIPLPPNSVDLLYSNDAFEHISKPWLAAQNIENVLKPGGIAFIATLFSWRYHPVPGDYYRYTHEGLVELFDGLECLEANFNSFHRREDNRGHWGSKRDHVPVDMLGGWRENWKVYYLGRKPLA
jgi:SAM-dependent methyltransferase